MSREKYKHMKMQPGQEVWFGDFDVPEEDHSRIVYPEELLDKLCGGCVRCEERHHAYKGHPAEGYHCMMQNYNIDIQPSDKACVHYWDRAEHERIEQAAVLAEENRRKELWAIYAQREPIKLPIVNDGFGMIPECPICREMPYSTEQCHWCGQRFIQDDEIKEYNTVTEETMDCFQCGGEGTVHFVRSKYNGHRHGHCEKCGMSFME